MKRLITANDVKALGQNGEKKIYADKNTLITPSAADMARDFKIEIVYSSTADNRKIEAKADEKSACNPKKVCNNNVSEIDIELIARIVKEVLSEGKIKKTSEDFIKESDISGLKLIRGNTVRCEKFDSGNPNSRVALRDIVNTRESPNMGAGFMTIEKSSFEWELCYEEFDYIIQGDLNITINGNTYKGHAGDVFFIPKNTKITWSTDGYAKFFYTTYPGNWAELAANK